MSGMSSLGIATSGMNAAQAGLYVTGHNMANIGTQGYTRQQILQNDFFSNTIGRNVTGVMQLGLGTDISAIRQIRDKFLDTSYRQTIAKAGFYDVKYRVGYEIQSILGELEGQYRFQNVLNDLRDAISELSKDCPAMETRGNFISTAIAFVEKANDTYNNLYKYQVDLNESVKETVTNINKLANEIKLYNDLIANAEAAGDNANDFRDKRNFALDELSSIATITYKERANGVVDVLLEGKELVVNGIVNSVGLRYTAPNCEFVEPVFTRSKTILEYDPTGNNAKALFSFNSSVNAVAGNDNGTLKGLLIARGSKPANYTSSLGNLDPTSPTYAADKFNVTNCTIPKAQMELDTLVHAIVTMINDMFAPVDPVTNKLSADAPYGQDGSQGTEIFSRAATAYANRFDPVTGELIAEDKDIYYSLYTIGNIVINQAVRNPEGYDKIATSLSGDESDPRLLLDMLKKWSGAFIAVDNNQPLSVENFYDQFIVSIAIETNESQNFVKNQTDLVMEISNFREAMSGVSMDEEMTNMMKYQHAFNAAARMVNVIDSMIDKLVNGTGRVGL